MADFPGLFKALLVSVVFHLALLWQMVPAPAVAASVVLQGHLRPTASAVIRTEPTLRAAPRPVAPPMAERGVAPPPAVSHAVTRPVAPPAAATLALPEQNTGVDAGGLRQYRVSLIARLAGVAGWRAEMVVQKSGRVVVAVQLPGSQMPLVTLVESDMDVSVSQAVLQAVRRSVAETALPASLVGQGVVLHLPFEFAP